MTKRDGNASDHLLTQAAALPQDELAAGSSGQPESIQTQALLAQVLERANLQRAMKQVRENKGAPGIDGMTVDELPDYLRHHWLEIRAQLETERDRPQPVKRVEIPKPDGKSRPLGIPTVLDCFIQQAIAQVVSAQWEPHFPVAGVRLHGWSLPNDTAVFYNRDKSLNPLQWNAINWQSAALCEARGCFIERKEQVVK